MARQLRIEYAGALYHVINRGNQKTDIFLTDEDRRDFLNLLSKNFLRYNWICYAYCLMDNHYHLLIETVDANLSKGMRQLNGVYTQRFNRRNGKVGHIFQGRYKSIVVDKDDYLMEVNRYIVLNPVRAKLVTNPREWRWSSYNDTIKKKRSKIIVDLDTDKILELFKKNSDEGIKEYKKYVLDGIGREEELLEKIISRVYLGRDAFIDKVKKYIGKNEHNNKEIRREERYVGRPSLEDIFKGQERREEKIYKANVDYGYTFVSIADYLGVHYSTVSKIYSRFKT